MANERDRMSNEGGGVRGGTSDRESESPDRRPGSESAEERTFDETSAERLRGTGDDTEDDEFEETDDLDEEDEEEEGTV